MTTERRMVGLIEQALKNDGISQAEFCRKVGVSPKHLNEVFRGKCSAPIVKLEYWAFALNRQFGISLYYRGESHSGGDEA